MTLFTKDRSFYKNLIKLAIPVALQNLITFAVGFADNLMVSKLGDSAVSGVYMGNQIQTFLQVFTVGIEGSILVLATQYWGKKDKSSIKKIVAVGLQFAVIFGLLLTAACAVFPSNIISLFTNEASVIESGASYLRIVCFSYVFFCVTQSLIASMRSVEVVRIGLFVSSVSLFVNVGLNYVLIFGKFGLPRMGINGAAAATLISRAVECAVMVIYVSKIDKRLELRLRDAFQTEKELRRDFIRYGLPIIAGQAVWSINMMANSAILGRFSEEVITAVSVANTMNTLAYVTMNGLSSAVGIITGKTVGAGQKELMKEYAKTVQIIFLSLGLVTGLAVFLLKNPFIGMYKGITAEAAEYSAQFISVLSVTLIGTCYQAACLFGLVKSGGDVTFVFKNDAFFVFLVVIPSALIASFIGAPAWVVFACLKCDQIFKCFVAAFKINRYDWMKNLTKSEAVKSQN